MQDLDQLGHSGCLGLVAADDRLGTRLLAQRRYRFANSTAISAFRAHEAPTEREKPEAV
jgi:hypothetical protein